MPDPLEKKTPIVRKLPILILIDVSGTMHEDNKIDSVNNAMSEVLEKLEDLEPSLGVDIELNVLTFGHSDPPSCRWMFDHMMQLNGVTWVVLEADGNTPLGDAYIELDSKLTTKGGFMTTPTAIYAPVLILITDGMPSNRRTAEEGLSRLRSNNWYLNSTRMALGIGLRNDEERKYLYDFVGEQSGNVFLSDSDGPALVAAIEPIVIQSTKMATRVTNVSTSNGETSSKSNKMNQSETSSSEEESNEEGSLEAPKED